MKIKFVDFENYFSEFSLNDEEKKNAEDFIYSDNDFSGTEVKASYSSGCFIFRYFSHDTGYYFSAPYPLSDFANIIEAYKSISEYCRLETVREIIVDIPKEEIELALRGAEHYELQTDEDDMSMVAIDTECMLLEEIPEVMIDDIYLGEFAFLYADEYEKMLKNENLNLHYGYNIMEDIPDADGTVMIENLKLEFENRESITLAATVLSDVGENVFVGEGVIFGFDGRSGAYAAFRVLPEWQRQGIGRKIFSGLLKIAKEIGLKKLFAEIKEENIASLALMNSFKSADEFLNGVYLYEFSL